MENDQEMSTSPYSERERQFHMSQDSQQRTISKVLQCKNFSLWQKYKQLQQKKEKEDEIKAAKLRLRKKLLKKPVNSIESSLDSVLNGIKIYGPKSGPRSTANLTPNNSNLEITPQHSTVNSTSDKENHNLEVPTTRSASNFKPNNRSLEIPISTANYTPDKDNRYLEVPRRRSAVNFPPDNRSLEIPGPITMDNYTPDKDNRYLEVPRRHSAANYSPESRKLELHSTRSTANFTPDSRSLEITRPTSTAYSTPDIRNLEMPRQCATANFNSEIPRQCSSANFTPENCNLELSRPCATTNLAYGNCGLGLRNEAQLGSVKQPIYVIEPSLGSVNKGNTLYATKSCTSGQSNAADSRNYAIATPSSTAYFTPINRSVEIPTPSSTSYFTTDNRCLEIPRQRSTATSELRNLEMPRQSSTAYFTPDKPHDNRNWEISRPKSYTPDRKYAQNNFNLETPTSCTTASYRPNNRSLCLRDSTALNRNDIEDSNPATNLGFENQMEFVRHPTYQIETSGDFVNRDNTQYGPKSYTPDNYAQNNFNLETRANNRSLCPRDLMALNRNDIEDSNPATNLGFENQMEFVRQPTYVIEPSGNSVNRDNTQYGPKSYTPDRNYAQNNFNLETRPNNRTLCLRDLMALNRNDIEDSNPASNLGFENQMEFVRHPTYQIEPSGDSVNLDNTQYGPKSYTPDQYYAQNNFNLETRRNNRSLCPRDLMALNRNDIEDSNPATNLGFENQMEFVRQPTYQIEPSGDSVNLDNTQYGPKSYTPDQYYAQNNFNLETRRNNRSLCPRDLMALNRNDIEDSNPATNLGFENQMEFVRQPTYQIEPSGDSVNLDNTQYGPKSYTPDQNYAQNNFNLETRPNNRTLCLRDLMALNRNDIEDSNPATNLGFENQMEFVRYPTYQIEPSGDSVNLDNTQYGPKSYTPDRNYAQNNFNLETRRNNRSLYPRDLMALNRNDIEDSNPFSLEREALDTLEQY